MTGGGPGGATKLYSILAYEKAIGSLQYGPGSAIALSVAPLMAILIYLLAKFMRHDERAAATGPKGRRTRIGTFFGGLFSLFLDVIFWPFDMLLPRRRAALAARSAAAITASPTSRCSSREGRERVGIVLRLLDPPADHDVRAVPVLLGDHHLVQIDAADQPAASIFWPNPFTLDQYRSLIFDSPFLIWLRQLGARCASSAR